MKNFFTILILLTLPAGCKKDPEPVRDISTRTAVLNNIGQNVIVTNFVSFQAASHGLSEAIASYVADSASLTKLSVLQNAWLATAIAWKHCALFTFGPLNDDFSTRYIDSRANPAAIEQFITDTSIPIVNATILPLPRDSRGLNALEYLIYGTDSGDKQAVIGAFTGSNGQRRCTFLRALGKDLIDKADVLLLNWSRAAYNYVTEFAGATGNEKTASIPVLVNRLITYTAALRENRIGLPLGILNGKPAPELVDGRFSNESHILLLAELESIYSVLSGNFTALSNTGGPGIYKLLAPDKTTEDDLIKRIDSQFNTIATISAKIAKPLSASLVSNPAAVKELYNALGNLVTTLETDLVAELKAKGLQV